MADREAVHVLEQALQERGVGLNRDDLLWAFENSDSRNDAEQWTKTYLAETTLLTKNELGLLDELKNKGRLGNYKPDTPNRAVLEPELRAVIRSLEKSTASIEKQTALLAVQKDALEELPKQRLLRDKVSRDARTKVRGQRLHETSRLGFSVEEIGEDLLGRLTTAQNEAVNSVERLYHGTNGRLSAHDRVLEALSKLAVKTRNSHSFTDQIAEVDAICRKLVQLRVRETRTRFENILQERLLDTDQILNGHDEPSISDQRELEQELETLMTDISSVIELVVAHEVRQPLLKTMRSVDAHGKAEQQAWSEYIFSTLKHSIAQTQVIQEHAQRLYDYGSALHQVNTAFAMTTRTPSSDTVRPSSNSAQGGELSKSRPPITPKSSSFSGSAFGGPSVTARSKDLTATQLLSRLDIVLPETRNSARPGFATMDSVTKASLKKISLQYKHLLEADMSILDSSLSARDEDVRLLRDRLFTFTPYQNVKLTDAASDTQIEGLDQGIKSTAQVFGEIETRIKINDETERILAMLSGL